MVTLTSRFSPSLLVSVICIGRSLRRSKLKTRPPHPGPFLGTATPPEVCLLVRAEGLEPPRLASPEPKSGASTSFATPAGRREAGRAPLGGRDVYHRGCPSNPELSAWTAKAAGISPSGLCATKPIVFLAVWRQDQAETRSGNCLVKEARQRTRRPSNSRVCPGVNSVISKRT